MKKKQKSLTKKDISASSAVTSGSAIGVEIRRVIADEIGGYEITHPAMNGATAAVHARVMIALGDIPRIIEWMETRAFMAYRDRDPDTGKLYDHFTVVNEDESSRLGHVAAKLSDAMREAFSSPNNQLRNAGGGKPS